MNSITKIISAAVLTTVAVSALAAPGNGPKPRCPMGQIAVLKNNMWVCAEPSIKSPAKPEAARSPTAKAPARVAPTPATPTKPERAKPDLSIANVMKQNDPTPNVDTFKVYVKNTENTPSPATKMSLNSPSGGGEVNVPAIPGNSGTWVQVTFFEYKTGDRIRLEVDSQKKVAETNESNNRYAFNW